MSKPGPQAWRVLALISAINFVNAGFPPYVGSALGPSMATDLALDRREFGLVFSAFLLMSGLWGPLVAAAIGRWGVRPVLASGSMLICAGSLSLGLLVNSAWGAILSYGVLVGGGAGVGGMLVSQTVVTRWFVEKRAFALSLVISAMALGGVAAAPAVGWLAQSSDAGWRGGWLLLAALTAATTILALAKIAEWPAQAGEAHEAAAETVTGQPEWTVARVIRTGGIWAIFAGAVGMSAALSFVMAHGPIHLRDLGYSQTMLSAWLSLLTIGQLSGTLGVGMLGDRVSARLLWAASLVLLGLGIVLVRAPGGSAALLLSGALCGFGIGGSMTGVMSTPAKYYGTLVYPALIGIVTPVLTISGALASYAGGAAFESTGSYDLAFGAIVALVAASAVFLIAMKPPKPA
jgi:MFS family permease